MGERRGYRLNSKSLSNLQPFRKVKGQRSVHGGPGALAFLRSIMAQTPQKPKARRSRVRMIVAALGEGSGMADQTNDSLRAGNLVCLLYRKVARLIWPPSPFAIYQGRCGEERLNNARLGFQSRPL